MGEVREFWRLSALLLAGHEVELLVESEIEARSIAGKLVSRGRELLEVEGFVADPIVRRKLLCVRPCDVVAVTASQADHNVFSAPAKDVERWLREAERPDGDSDG